MDGTYAAAPFMADRWQNSATGSRDELGDVYWAAHTTDRPSGSPSPDRAKPPGKNFLFEDGSVQWFNKEALRVSLNYSSTNRQFMHDTQPAGLVADY